MADTPLPPSVPAPSQKVDRRPFWYFWLAVAATFALAVYAFKRPGPPEPDDPAPAAAVAPSESGPPALPHPAKAVNP